MRSLLFVPGDSERKLAKGLSSGADALIIDLEDSVALTRKAEARAITADFLRANQARNSGQTLIVRVNALSTGLTDDDLAGVIAAGPDAILLPKSNSGADVQQLSVMIGVHEVRNGIPEGTTRIHALVTETAAGTLNAGTYAGKSERLTSLSWGGEDLAADLGAQANRDENGAWTDVFRLARAMTLLGASAAGVDTVDTVFTDFSDMEGLEAECIVAERDGFSGKLAIHPAQVPVINRVFTPSEQAVERARLIVDLFAKAGSDAGVLSLNGQMIDRPHLRQAERILARAQKR